MQVVLLAAGRGTRLRPYTRFRSKPMAPIKGKPIIHRIMKTFWNAGLNDFIIVKSPNDKHIEKYLSRSIPAHINIKFVDQKVASGMADSVEVASSYISEDFIVSAADSLMEPKFVKEFVDIFSTKKWNSMIAVMEADNKSISFSSAVKVNEDYEVESIIEKPSINKIDTNLLGLPFYAFKLNMLKHIQEVNPSKRGEREIQDLISIIINRYGKVKAVVANKRHNLTDMKDLITLNLKFLLDNK